MHNVTQLPNLNYANQDLRNCSFSGRNLTGVDFSGSDIRGCDFSQAILAGANFERVRTGQSCRQVVTLIFSTVGLAGIFSLAVESGSSLNIDGSAATAGFFTVSAAFAVAGAYFFAIFTSAAFNYNKNFSEFTGIMVTIVCVLFATYCLIEAVKTLKNATGTSFKKADLTNAKFCNALLKNTDFSDATLTGIDWTNAFFKYSITGLVSLEES